MNGILYYSSGLGQFTTVPGSGGGCGCCKDGSTSSDVVNARKLVLTKGLTPAPAASDACTLAYNLDPASNSLDIIGYGLAANDKRRVRIWDDCDVQERLTVYGEVHTNKCVVNGPLIVTGPITGSVSSSKSTIATFQLSYGYTDIQPYNNGQSLYVGVGASIPGNPSSDAFGYAAQGGEAFMPRGIIPGSFLLKPPTNPTDISYPALFDVGTYTKTSEAYTQFRILFWGCLISADASLLTDTTLAESRSEFDVVSYVPSDDAMRPVPDSAFMAIEAGMARGYQLIPSPWMDYSDLPFPNAPTLYIRYRGNSTLGTTQVPEGFEATPTLLAARYRYGPIYMQVM